MTAKELKDQLLPVPDDAQVKLLIGAGTMEDLQVVNIVRSKNTNQLIFATNEIYRKYEKEEEE